MNKGHGTLIVLGKVNHNFVGTCLSKSLLNVQSIVMGLQLLHSDLFPPLCIGVTHHYDVHIAMSLVIVMSQWMYLPMSMG